MRARIIAALASSIVVGISGSAWAQGDAPKKAEESEPAKAAGDKAEGKKGAEAVAGDREAAKTPEGEAGAAGSTPAGAAGGDPAAGGGPRLGPGGKPLRTDYPGRPEAMQPRMETDRIKGINLDKLKEPDEVYDLRIKELETKIDDLKEKVFRSKSRVVLLKETLLGGKLAGSQAVVVFKNEVGGFYKLRRALVTLDGANIFNRRDNDGSLSEKEELQLFSGTIAPGAHTVGVFFKIEGDGGMFSYFDGYNFELRNNCPLTVEEGRASILTITIKEKGGALAKHEDRPGVDCKVKVANLKQVEKLKKESEANKKKEAEPKK